MKRSELIKKLLDINIPDEKDPEVRIQTFGFGINSFKINGITKGGEDGNINISEDIDHYFKGVPDEKDCIIVRSS